MAVHQIVFDWLNKNSGAIQAISTVVLVESHDRLRPYHLSTLSVPYRTQPDISLGNHEMSDEITFDVDVQINSKPWAEVFRDGVERKALGQTPLSGVRVPIGSVLVFENPGFPKQKYRVTGSETGIQNVFP